MLTRDTSSCRDDLMFIYDVVMSYSDVIVVADGLRFSGHISAHFLTHNLHNKSIKICIISLHNLQSEDK